MGCIGDVLPSCVKKILWLSRHDILPEQVAELRSAFGKVEFVKHGQGVESGAEVFQLFNDLDRNEMVVVLPLPLLAELLGEIHRAGRMYDYSGL